MKSLGFRSHNFQRLALTTGLLPRCDLSKLVNLRAARKPISDARTTTYLILSTGSGPGGRWFKSTRPDQISLLESISYLTDLHTTCEFFCALGAPFLKPFARDQSFFSEFMALPREVHFTASLFLGEIRYRPAHLGEKSSRCLRVCRGHSHFPERRLNVCVRASHG